MHPRTLPQGDHYTCWAHSGPIAVSQVFGQKYCSLADGWEHSQTCSSSHVYPKYHPAICWGVPPYLSIIPLIAGNTVSCRTTNNWER